MEKETELIKFFEPLGVIDVCVSDLRSNSLLLLGFLFSLHLAYFIGKIVPLLPVDLFSVAFARAQ